jgi:hypothetical protein
MILGIDLVSRFGSAFGFVAERGLDRSALTEGIYPVSDKHWADLTFTSTDNGKQYRMANGKPAELMSGVLCPAPMVSLKRDKNIIKTAIDNSDFEVVESFGLKSWEITIEGILVDMENHAFPYDRMREFREIFEAQNTFKVESDLFYTLGIDEIYFEKIEEFEVLKEYQDTVKFKVKAWSVKPLEYFLN